MDRRPEITALTDNRRSAFYEYFDVKSGVPLTSDRATWALLFAFFADNEIFLRAVLGDNGSVHFIARLQGGAAPFRIAK